MTQAKVRHRQEQEATVQACAVELSAPRALSKVSVESTAQAAKRGQGYLGDGQKG